MTDWEKIAAAVTVLSGLAAILTFAYQARLRGEAVLRSRRLTAQAEMIEAWSDLELEELQGLEGNRGAHLSALESREREGASGPRRLSAKVSVRNNSTAPISRVVGSVHLFDAQDRPIRVQGATAAWLATVPSQTVAVADSLVQYQGLTPRVEACYLLFTDANGRHWYKDMRTGSLTEREKPADPRYLGGNFDQY